MDAEPAKSEALVAAEELDAMKVAGNDRVKQQDWSGALNYYQKVLELADEKRTLFMGDLEAEMAAERCVLATMSNMALCALKRKDYGKAKQFCADAILRHARVRRPDPSGRAKVLFRRGQAFLGLDEPRMAVDSISEAIAIEEQLLGATNKDAALKTADDKQRVATIHSMKRELLKARKAATAADKASVSKGQKGFLNVKANRITDPKADRHDIIVKDLDRL